MESRSCVLSCTAKTDIDTQTHRVSQAQTQSRLVKKKKITFNSETPHRTSQPTHNLTAAISWAGASRFL